MPIWIVRLLVRRLPPALALACIHSLTARIKRPPLTDAQVLAMSAARRLTYGSRRNAAFEWGAGPLVVLAHGWGGCAAQLAPLAIALAANGFRCIALDVTGHGDSPGDRTSWACFMEDIAELAAEAGQAVHAFVGHSAGGLAMMAARKLKGIRARRYVCICAPSHPFPPIRAIQEKLAPPGRILDACKEHIAKQFQSTWADLERGSAFASVDADLLLFYDEKDRFVASTEGDRIQALCPHAKLLKSTSHGHTKILSASELARAVVEFTSG